MARASRLIGLGAALALAAPAAMAGEAPVAFYPSLGYGQIPPAEAPPPAPPPPARALEAPAPAQAMDRQDVEGRELRTYESRSEVEAESETGWRVADAREAAALDEGAAVSEGREDYAYDSGWRIRRIPMPGPGRMMCPYAREEGPPPPPHAVCPPPSAARAYDRRYAEADERLPDTFFADAGGVGPDEFDWGGGGGGGYVVGGASSGAFASASAHASVSLGVRIGRHGGGHHGGGPAPHGCGCKK